LQLQEFANLVTLLAPNVQEASPANAQTVLHYSYWLVLNVQQFAAKEHIKIMKLPPVIIVLPTVQHVLIPQLVPLASVVSSFKDKFA
jgi:hypothetical protein